MYEKEFENKEKMIEIEVVDEVKTEKYEYVDVERYDRDYETDEEEDQMMLEALGIEDLMQYMDQD